MNHRIINSLMVILGSAALAGCATPNEAARVHVEYEQLANFYTYKLSADSSSSHGAGNGVFVLYKIRKITNTGSEAATFTFDKHKVVAVVPDKTSNEEPSGDNILLGGSLADNVSVAAGQTKLNPGCIIKHVLTANPQTLQAALIDLIYSISSSQPVSMKRSVGDTTTAQVGTALPSTLQNFCSN
jgi:hypothetical protein